MSRNFIIGGIAILLALLWLKWYVTVTLMESAITEGQAAAAEKAALIEKEKKQSR